MKEKTKQVDEITSYLALAVSILDEQIDLSDTAFKVLEGNSKVKLNSECLKLLKYVGGSEDMENVMLKLDRKTAEVLYKFTSLLDLRFEMTLCDRMMLNEDEANDVSEAFYNLNEILRKMVE